MNKNVIFKIIIFLCLFLFFFIALIYVFVPYQFDAFANYGFSYALLKGEIPYRDFNLVVPLFSPFLYSIPMIFNISSLTFIGTQALLLTILFDYFYKLIGKKIFIILLLMVCIYPVKFSVIMYPGYNFILLFLFTLFLFYNQKKKHIIIGMLLGCILLTKHTVGAALFFVYLLMNYKDKKINQVILFAFIPILIFTVYLFINGCLYDFVDLALLGLFDFGSNNTYYQLLPLVLFIMIWIYSIWRFLKMRNSNYLYLLAFSIMSIPIIDDNHIAYLLLCFILIIMIDVTFKFDIDKKEQFLFVFAVCVLLFLDYRMISSDADVKIYHFHNHPIVHLGKHNNYLFKKITKYKNKDTHYLFEIRTGIIYKSMNDMNLDYYNYMFRGNFGKRGAKRIIDDIKLSHDSYYIVDTVLMQHSDDSQYPVEVLDYIDKCCVSIEKIGSYIVYYKK